MRIDTRWILGGLAALALASGTAWAAHHEGDEGAAQGKPAHAGHHGKRFEKRDTDGNGEISKAEWMAGSEQHFEKLDADGNGSVSREEMQAAHKKMKNRHGKKGGASDASDASDEADEE